MAQEVGAWIHLIRLIVVAGAGYGGLFAKRWTQRRREQAASSWMSIEAHVVAARAEPVEKTHRYIALIQYSFFAGEYRVGEYHHEFSNETQADDFVRPFRNGKVLIRYNPANPDESVLERSVVEQMIALSPRLG